MKWSVVALVAIGLVAAGSAAFLVAALRASRPSDASAAMPTVDVLTAAKPLPAMSVVGSDCVVIRKTPVSQAPSNFMSDPVAVVGKVLRLAMIQDQAFTPSVLATRDSGINLAAAVRQGMRAVSVSLSDYGAMDGLLYPGSSVDVLFSFKAPPGSGSRNDETISTTLLRGVQVLAIEGRTILSADDSAAPPTSSARNMRKQMVTLMVTLKQAELLQLAQEHGAISLALRNPMETESAAGKDEEATKMSEFFRRHLVERIAGAATQPSGDTRSQQGLQWPVTFLRAGNAEVQNFPAPRKGQATP